MISATALKSCPRKFVLERTTDYYDVPIRSYSAIRGTIVHGFVEHERPGVVTERRLYTEITEGPFAPWTISGCLDYLDITNKSLEDYKTSVERACWYLFNYGVKPEHTLQLGVYRWLAKFGHLGSLDGPVMGWDVDKAVIHTLMMDRAISSGQKYEYLVADRKSPNWGKPYNLEVSREVVSKNRKGTPVWRLVIDIPPVVLMPYDEVYAYILEKGPALVRGFREPSWMPSGVMHDTEDNWQCGFCPVSQLCEQHEQSIALSRLDETAGLFEYDAPDTIVDA